MKKEQFTNLEDALREISERLAGVAAQAARLSADFDRHEADHAAELEEAANPPKEEPPVEEPTEPVEETPTENPGEDQDGDDDDGDGSPSTGEEVPSTDVPPTEEPSESDDDVEEQIDDALEEVIESAKAIKAKKNAKKKK